MRLSRFPTIILFSLVVLFGLHRGALAEMASGDVLVNTCFSCHGPDGKSSGAMPTIAGKPKHYIETMMRNYRSGKTPSTVMMRIAKGFSDTEIAAIAKFFADK